MAEFIVRLSGKQKELMTEELLKGHVAFLSAATESGQLQFCGFCGDDTAVMVFAAATEDEVRTILKDDPFNEVAYYQNVEITSFWRADQKNNFHLESGLKMIRNSKAN